MPKRKASSEEDTRKKQKTEVDAYLALKPSQFHANDFKIWKKLIAKNKELLAHFERGLMDVKGVPVKQYMEANVRLLDSRDDEDCDHSRNECSFSVTANFEVGPKKAAVHFYMKNRNTEGDEEIECHFGDIWSKEGENPDAETYWDRSAAEKLIEESGMSLESYTSYEDTLDEEERMDKVVHFTGELSRACLNILENKYESSMGVAWGINEDEVFKIMGVEV